MIQIICFSIRNKIQTPNLALDDKSKLMLKKNIEIDDSMNAVSKESIIYVFGW